MSSFTKLSFKMAVAMLVAACAILVPLSLSEDSAAVSTESELKDAVRTGGNIAINGTITLTSTLNIDSGTTFSLSGGSLTVSDADGVTANSVISVTNGNVTLSNITIIGGTEAAIKVSGGSLTIGDGVTITGSKTGISVTGGSLTVSGGNITNNNGGEAGGIFVSDSSTFLMTGGSITHNEGTSAGGILIRNNTGATISGGTIAGNEILSSGAGGIGLHSGSSLTITGGTVRDNIGAGIASLSETNDLTLGSSDSISKIIVIGHSGNGNVLVGYENGSVLNVTIRGDLTGSEIWFTGTGYWLSPVGLDTDYRFAKLDGTYHDSMQSSLHLDYADDAIAAYVGSNGKLLVGEAGTELLGGPDHSESTQSDMYFTIATPESDTVYVSQDRGGNGTVDRPFGTIADAVDRAGAIGATKVVLRSNLTSQSAVEVSTSITLDLNGFSITSGEYSALILDDPDVRSTGLEFNIVGTGTIQGAAGQYGESGNAGISGSFTGTVTLGSGVTVRGGDGGDGYYYDSTLTPSGAGGSGISMSGATVILEGATIRGGDGGDGASGDNPSNGGDGGAGIVANTVTIASTTTSTVIAGNGGNGGSSTSNGGAGGNGGTPLRLTNTTVKSQGGSFIGGNGGNGGYSQTRTPGGAGSAGAIDESITISGSFTKTSAKTLIFL